jgi:hypothetical protein
MGAITMVAVSVVVGVAATAVVDAKRWQRPPNNGAHVTVPIIDRIDDAILLGASMTSTAAAAGGGGSGSISD